MYIKKGIFLTIMEPGVSIEYKSLQWSQLWTLHKQGSINVKLTEQEKLFEVRFCFNRRKSQGYFFRYVAFFSHRAQYSRQTPSYGKNIKTQFLLSGALLFHQGV